jgi:hypothetical protein
MYLSGCHTVNCILLDGIALEINVVSACPSGYPENIINLDPDVAESDATEWFLVEINSISS